MDLRVEPLLVDRTLELDTHGPTVLFPLRSSAMECEVRGTQLRLDRTLWGLAPAGCRLALRALTPGARVLMATPRSELIAQVAERYRAFGLDEARLAELYAEPQLLPRTVWVDEIVQRYLFERQVCAGFDNEATRFLEAELVKESYYLLRDRDEGVDRASIVQEHSEPVARALAHVEAHLFETPDVPILARVAGASESTLLRAFKRELGCTPSAYWRMRRLDEALVLLESGRHSVAEVAGRVGYDNPSAFAHAFQLRFGAAPSSIADQSRRR